MNEINVLFSFFLGFIVSLLLERVIRPLIVDCIQKKGKKTEDSVLLSSPCETCLRWDECNGEDDTCPLIKEEPK